MESISFWRYRVKVNGVATKGMDTLTAVNIAAHFPDAEVDRSWVTVYVKDNAENLVPNGEPVRRGTEILGPWEHVSRENLDRLADL